MQLIYQMFMVFLLQKFPGKYVWIDIIELFLLFA